MPEAATLLGWARELGIPIGEEGAGAEPAAGQPARKASMDDLIRALGIKGFANGRGRGRRARLGADQVQPLLDDLVVDGLAASVAGAYRLTDTGKERASELVEAERTRWGAARATPRSMRSSRWTSG